jgi:hypothetical protein
MKVICNMKSGEDEEFQYGVESTNERDIRGSKYDFDRSGERFEISKTSM